MSSYETELSTALRKRMGEKGISIIDLANAADVVYETARKVVTGERNPSKRLLRDICVFLVLDFDDHHKMLVAQQITKKFGGIPAKLAGKNPEMQSIENLWGFLLPEEKEHITWLVRQYALRSKIVDRPARLQPKIAPQSARPR